MGKATDRQEVAFAEMAKGSDSKEMGRDIRGAIVQLNVPGSGGEQEFHLNAEIVQCPWE